MQFRNTIIALIVLAIIGGVAYYASRQPAPEKTPKLFTIKASEIQRIELKAPHHDLVLERGTGASWRLVKPIAADADQSTAQDIASAIADLAIVGTADEHATDLAPFGLENPIATVTVTTKDKRVLPSILVGKDTPVGGSAFIKTDDKPAVLLVSNVFPAQVNKNLNDLRSKVLIGFTPDQINRVVITHSDGTIVELQRKGEVWSLEQPRSHLADAGSVRGLLNILTDARVASFISDQPTDLAQYGLAKPSLTVAVYGGKDNALESLEFGFAEPEADKNATYVRRGEGDQPVATVADNVVKAAADSYDDLRDKTVLLFDRTGVGSLELMGGPVKLTVTRDPKAKWTVHANGVSKPADPMVVESLLDQLHRLKGSKIVQDPLTDAPRYGMVHPNLTIGLTDKAGKSIGTINVAEITMSSRKPAPGQTRPVVDNFGYAMSSADQAVYEIPPEQVADLENTALHLHQTLTATPTPTPAPKPANATTSASPGH